MSATTLAALQGSPTPKARRSAYRDGWTTFAPALCLLGFVLLCGLYLPPPLRTLLEEAAASLEAVP